LVWRRRECLVIDKWAERRMPVRGLRQGGAALSRNLGRIVLGLTVGVIGMLVWAGLAGGTQPYDTYQTTIASDGPVAQYRFDDTSGSSTLADSAGSFTAMNSGVTLGGEGPFGGSKSGSFAGEAYASLASDPLEEASEFTAEAWVYWSGGSPYDQPIFDFGSGATNHLYLTPAASGSGHDLLFEVHTSEGASAQVTAPELGDGAWHYVAVTESSTGELKLYLDGTEVGNSTEAAVDPASLGSVATAYLGKSLASAPNFEGRLSNVAFYTKALSGSRILAHYDAGEFPVSAMPPTISGTAEEDSTLSEEAGSWTGLAPITFGYQWRRCNGSGESCSDISGATSSTYNAGYEDVGHKLRVLLTATNGAGSGEALSSTSAFVAPAPLTEFGYASEFGTEGSGDGQFKEPYGVTIGAGGDIFVLDRGNDRVEKFNEAGEYLGQFGEEGSGNGQLRSPDALAVDSKEDVFVADTGNERVEEFNEHGEFLRTFGEGLVGSAEGIAVDRHGRVWVSATYEGHLVVFGEDGEFLKDVGSSGSEPGELGEPEDLAVDAEGHVWVADYTGRVEEFDEETGEFLSQFGSSGEGAGQLSGSFGIAVDAGHVFVGRLGSPRVQEFDEEGGFIAQLGVPGTETGDLESSAGLDISQAYDLLIADSSNDRVEDWSPEGPGGPANLAQPSISGSPGVGSTLAASAGVWRGSPRRSYSYQWEQCNESGEECEDIVGATGSTYSVVGTDLGSTLRVVVTATNTHGSASSTSAASEPITVPPVNISPPTILGTVVEGQELTADLGTWEGASFYDVEWQRCNEYGEECEYIEWGESYTATAADVGHTLRVIVYAENGAGQATATSALTSVVTAATPPANLSAPDITGIARDGQTLSVSDGEWEGTPTPTYTYQWEGCNATGGECEDIAGATSSTYTLQDGDVGGSVRVIVTASNVVGSASATSAASARVAPVAPVNSSLPSILGSSVEGQILTASPGVWSGSPAPSYTFQWERCNSGGESCSDIEGVTGTTYLLGAVDVGYTLRVRVVATNAATSATASSSATATVESTGAVAPSNTALPTISGSPEDGQALTASAGSWEGTSPIAYAYQWQSCNEAGSDCEAIEGATDSTYRLAPTDEQTTLRVLVTTSGPGGRAQAVSEASATIQPGAPSELEAPSISGSPSAGVPLNAEVGAWGGSEVQFSYQWERCNEAGEECRQIPGASEAEYIPGEGDAASTLRVRIGSGNALGSLTALSPVSTPVQPAGVLLNTATPTISGEPVSGGTLSASPGGWLGGGAISYAYEWQRCDLYGGGCKDIAGAGASTYNPVDADVGHTLRVRVSASELDGAASEISSTTAPVAATGAPVVEEPPSIAGTGLVGYTLTATAGVWAGEAGETGYAYQWERCDETGAACSAIAGATEDSYTLTEADAGSAIRVLVSASDPGGSSEAVSAPIIASAQSVAEIAPSQVSGSDELGRPLQASTGIWTGSGAIAISYEWERCDADGESCTGISGAEASSYSPIDADAGHALRVKTTATGLGESASATSPATPPIGSEATAPENTALPAIEGQFTVGDSLTATAGSWSGSETITHTYQWQRCNPLGAACVEIEGASSDTYTLTEADLGLRIRVLVGASNSAGSESAVSEASEEVGAAGPPANTQKPQIIGRAVEGQQLVAGNGDWLGSKPFTYYYRWERCNTAGESCATITGTNQPSYTLVSADVGATVRVNVTADNGLGKAGSISSPTDVVVSATQAGISAAREAIEGTDPSLLARSTSATIEEQSLTPAITDSGEAISSQSTLASSKISKITPGEFSLETADGPLSLTPVKPSLSADRMPTIANGTTALFAETWHESDTIVRPSVLGAIALLQLRSEHAPTSESWEVGLGARQQLEQLPDGSVAIIEPTPEASLESPPGEEGPALGSSEAPAHEEGEGFDRDKGEEELNSSLAEESALGPLSAAPTISVTETSPKEHELHPQDTKEHYEHDKSAMSYAEEHTSDTALMVIEVPTVMDAAGHTVPATLVVEGDTITLTISPEPEVSYPITAEVATAAPTDLVSIARDPVEYGLSDPKASVFENLNAGLTKAPLNIKVARDVVPYYAWQSATGRKDLLKWLQAVGEHKNLKPYITVEAGGHTNISYTEYAADMHELISELMNGKEEIEVSSEKFKDIPEVKLWGAWNEPDYNNPLDGNASEAAVLWKIADLTGEELHCGCEIAAGEFHEYGGYIAKYINTILHDHSYGIAVPHVWGLHDYYDLEHLQRHTNEHKGNVDLEKFLKEVSGSVGAPRIWISETGVTLQNGHTLTGLKTSAEYAKLQVAAANDVLKLANGHPRVELVNYYLYEGPTKKYEEKPHEKYAFDSALMAGDKIVEKQKPREAYCVLVLGKHKGCPAGGITKTPPRDSLTADAATMAADVEPHELPTTYSFQYGTTTAYGQTTSVTSLPNEIGEQSVTAALSGLEPCTTYHYQVEAENEANEEVASLGGDQSFTTSCPGRITAFAGDGWNVRSGDGGEATKAGLERIGGLAADPDGDVFIAEPGLNNIREVNSEGIIDRVAGMVNDDQSYIGDGGPAIDAYLGEPSALAVSASGTVYVAEDWSQVVRAFTPGGKILTFAGKLPAVNSLCGTRDRLYSGDGGPADEAGFGTPLTLAVGPDGSLYIADWNDEVVRKVDAEGTITTVAGYFDSGALKEHNIHNAFDPSELLCEFYSYEPEKPSLSGNGGPATSATLGEPTGVAVGQDGSIYISDTFDDVIRRVAPDGTISTFAGTGEVGYSGDGGPATEAKLDDPAGLAVGPEGSVYIADSCNAVIRRVAPDGVITTVAGTGELGEGGDGGQATEAQLENPTLIAADSNGNLYIGSNETDKVRKIEAPLGTGTTNDEGGDTCPSEEGIGGG
jgi:Concanavalin A-like lectin/glucanases superfamily